MKCSPEAFRCAHAIFGDYARAFPGTTAAQWKAALLVLWPIFAAEANGHPLPAPAPRESTLEIDGPRMNDLIECCLWLGAEVGVDFKEDQV